MNRYFGKSKAKAISEIEYSVDGSVVRVSSQIRVEQAIMVENSQWFVLAYNSLLLRKDIVEKIGFKGEKEASSLLISQGVMVPGVSSDLAGFLKLLYQLSQCYINYHITTAQWNTH